MSLSEWPSISYTSGYISDHVTFKSVMEESDISLRQKSFKLPGRNQVCYASFKIKFLSILSIIIIIVDQCDTCVCLGHKR